MRTFLLSLTALLLLASPALALDTANLNFYVQGMFSLPVGDFGDAAGSGYGGGLGIRVPYSESLNFRGEAGYLTFGSETASILGNDYDLTFSMIPVTVLGEYFITADDLFYILGGVGVYNLRWEYDFGADADVIDVDDSDSETKFGVCFGAGYAVNSHISIEGRYNIISDANQVTIHGIIHF